MIDYESDVLPIAPRHLFELVDLPDIASLFPHLNSCRVYTLPV